MQPGRKLEGELGPLPYEGPSRAGRQIPVGTGREVPPEVLDSLRGLNRQQLTNMLINYYHSIRGARLELWSAARDRTPASTLSCSH